MSTSSVILIDCPTPKALQPDRVTVSYLKSIAAADPRAICHKQEESPQKYRLLSQFDPEIIEIILKYAKGNEDDCQRTHCRRPVHMTDTLRNFKACAICRAKRALNDNKVPDAVMATKGFMAPARSGPKTKKGRKMRLAPDNGKGKERQPSAKNDSNTSYIPSPWNTSPPFLNENAARCSNVKLQSRDDQEHANMQSHKIFTRNIYNRVMDTYIIGRQIDITEYLVMDTPAEITLADSMAYIIDALKATLCSIWPYAAGIKHGYGYSTINTNIACTRMFGCTYWVPNEGVNEDGQYLHDCEGTVNFVTTHCPQLGENMHQIHVAFVHPGTNQS
ncbi:hypothetical protein FIBSPDRAFT_881423 [Athelia psychrophila]|uniref:Uncharacterized protein n=1 Tax=Athelia psychrophila TaxID=1759441 RepID=A0A166WNH0_9AGAM|nr:hypothetical protein FIBSPDRAFT_881423 [Fibularhizoctonia sp. CBS 109695]